MQRTNRPHLLDRVFTNDAVLEIQNASSAITFPEVTSGREAIADVLVRSFRQTYENVYSYYLQRPNGPLPAFECQWLVAMTEKSSRSLRVGCGQYLWLFEPSPPGLARRLLITIAEMLVLPSAVVPETLASLAALSYPWSSPAQVKEAASGHSFLALVVRHLRAA